MKIARITTTNREIYEKFNLLNFKREIILDKKLERLAKTAINSINKNDEFLTIDKIGRSIVVKRKNPICISAYLR